MKKEHIDMVVVSLSFMYIGYVKPLRVGEKFIDKLCENIKKLEFPEQLEDHFLALAIAAFGSKPKVREELCSRALDALNVLLAKTPIQHKDVSKGKYWDRNWENHL